MTNKVVNFISDDMFEKAKPGLCLLDFLVDCIKSFRAAIEKLTAIALPKFEGGFDKQKGAIFGFGPSLELDSSGGVLKISRVDHETSKKVDSHVEVHNLTQERNV